MTATARYTFTPVPSAPPTPSPSLVPVCGCEVAGQYFCNYDNGATGTCEACSDRPPDTAPYDGCYNWGLPAAGAADCVRWCSVI